ncbi:MAG: neutral/alkaline non-lysosomal ceramidase N-terminal domain-containing protein, partial [Cyclobacteriaceae bacterium]|nr:neutral/alkaline non-lysosomal ceramidase N-terminal domain-containing protein [Cyclobacteriaceae bacterium]
MRKLFFSSALTFLLVLTFQIVESSNVLSENGRGWKAGVARMVITPQQSMWLAGYAARTDPSDGKLHDLWAKALALEDADGKQTVLITTDLLGLPKIMSDKIRDRLMEKYKLSRAQIILNSSHTHSGPVLQDALFDIYPLDSIQLKRINRYSDWLEDQIVALTGEAMQAMKPAQL